MMKGRMRSSIASLPNRSANQHRIFIEKYKIKNNETQIVIDEQLVIREITAEREGTNKLECDAERQRVREVEQDRYSKRERDIHS
mgnify:CR=1 FL=1